MSRAAATLTAKTDEWLTPPDVLDRIRTVMPIAFDPCPSPISFVAPSCVPPGMQRDGLLLEWYHCFPLGLGFVNPPYSTLAKWLRKCATEDARGVPVAALVPFRSDTAAMQDDVLGNAWVFAFRGRLKFWRAIEVEYAEVEARTPTKPNLRRLETLADAAARGETVVAGGRVRGCVGRGFPRDHWKVDAMKTFKCWNGGLGPDDRYDEQDVKALTPDGAASRYARSIEDGEDSTDVYVQDGDEILEYHATYTRTVDVSIGSPKTHAVPS